VVLLLLLLLLLLPLPLLMVGVDSPTEESADELVSVAKACSADRA
jgi:hypothetical protein